MCITFGLNSSLPPLVGGGDGLLCESVGAVDLLSDNFDNTTSPGTASLAIRLLVLSPSPSGRVRLINRLLLDLDPYGGTLGMFLLFLNVTADVLTPCFNVMLRRLLHLCCFPA